MTNHPYQAAVAAMAFAAAACAGQAQAATQSTRVDSVLGGFPAADFTIAPVAALPNTPVHVYLSGYGGGYLHCSNEAGCGAFSARVSVVFEATIGEAITLRDTVSLGTQSFAATAYGDFIDLTPVRFSAPELTLTYAEALAAGLVDTGKGQLLQGHLALRGQSLKLDGISFFDIYPYAFGLLTPQVNVHYLADPNPLAVPEPATSALALLGSAGVAGLVRRKARAGR